MRFKSLLFKINLNSPFRRNVNCLKHTWEQPEGHHTRINLYNCITRQNEPFIVQNPNAVTWYTCGPTVYDSTHIGHASCYVKLDIIQRILKDHFKLNIVTVMNITDIDDKIIKRANELKLKFKEVSNKYEKEFWDDMNSLKIHKPNFVVRVTENMDLIVKFIEELINNKQAYIGPDKSVYFDVKSNSDNYGKLQNIGDSFKDQKNQNKKSPMDFALWKSQKSEDEPSWLSPWGKGRPGWHIECSALASHIFGEIIDIHAGGIDLRFPHHENEEIQSCSFHKNNQWVNYWVHTGHLHLKDSEKMSKSLKNTVLIKDMLEETTPDVFRLACAMSHYSSRIEFSRDWLNNASNVLKTFKNFSTSILEVEKGVLGVHITAGTLKDLLNKSYTDVDAALCNNFNTSQVIEILHKVVSVSNSMIVPSKNHSLSRAGDIYYLLALHNFVKNTLNLFGIEIDDYKSVSNVQDSIEFIDMLVDFRQNVRELGLNQKNLDLLKMCDKIRNDLHKNGVMIKDHGKISSWSKQ